MPVILEDHMEAKRASVRLSSDSWSALVALTERDGITISDRVGALVEMWRTDPALQERLEPAAIEAARESRRRRYGSRTKT